MRNRMGPPFGVPPSGGQLQCFGQNRLKAGTPNQRLNPI